LVTLCYALLKHEKVGLESFPLCYGTDLRFSLGLSFLGGMIFLDALWVRGLQERLFITVC
jgi:hypothetical protein